MANVKVPLTVKEVEQLKATGVHSVGGFPGLCLQVTPSGGRSWILRYTIGGQRKKIGLGSFPSVSLRESREKAQSISNQIRAGIDPANAKPPDETSPTPESNQASTPQQATAQAMSFSACARQYIIAHRAGWANVKHSQQWENTLARYADPVIGALPPSAITVDHLLEILTPIWSAKTETARRLRSRIELVLNYARALRLRSGDNPALWRGNLDSLLPNPRKVTPVKHHEAVDVEAARAVFQSIRAMDSIGARCLQFTILTACHRRLKLTATVHGWRSTFKDWAAEKTSYANELSEMALAHAVSSGVESAYRRGDFFERRRAMMDDWAGFLESPR